MALSHQMKKKKKKYVCMYVCMICMRMRMLMAWYLPYTALGGGGLWLARAGKAFCISIFKADEIDRELQRSMEVCLLDWKIVMYTD